MDLIKTEKGKRQLSQLIRNCTYKNIRLDDALYLFKELITTTKDGFYNLGEKVDQSRIEITSEIHSLRDDFNTHFDIKISEIEYELAEIKDKVKLDFKDVMENNNKQPT